MFEIRPARTEDTAAAVATLGQAFGQDPLMAYLFGENPDGVGAGVMAFFSILLRVRLSLGMPAYVLQDAGGVMGAAMGYDTSRPAWPQELAEEWHQLETRVPGFAPRLAAYDALGEACQPKEDHYYLGVLGIHPSLQGKGAGKAMLDAFCALSNADPQSRGVYLDTTNPSSLQFYYHNGFELLGEGSLDTVRLWCVYKRR